MPRLSPLPSYYLIIISACRVTAASKPARVWYSWYHRPSFPHIWSAAGDVSHVKSGTQQYLYLEGAYNLGSFPHRLNSPSTSTFTVTSTTATHTTATLGIENRFTYFQPVQPTGQGLRATDCYMKRLETNLFKVFNQPPQLSKAPVSIFKVGSILAQD